MMFGSLISMTVFLMLYYTKEETVSWSKLREMSRDNLSEKAVMIEGYLVSSWVNPEGDKKNSECWTLISEQHPLLDNESDYLVASLGFNIVPDEANIIKVRLFGHYSNELNLYKQKNNLGYLSKVDSIHFLEVSDVERENIAFKIRGYSKSP
jgi:hypothetical protein